jgi:hypothetical protein
MLLLLYEVINDKIAKLGDFEFVVCPRIDEIIQVSGPMGDLDLKVVRVEHGPVEIPKNIVTEDKKPTLSLYVKFESRYSG